MIKYDNNTVNKIYKGDNIVNKIDDYISGIPVTSVTWESVEELAQTHTVVQVASNRYTLEPTISGITFFRLNMNRYGQSYYCDLYREHLNQDNYFGIQSDRNGTLYKAIDGYRTIKDAADSSSCTWAYWIDQNTIEVNVVEAVQDTVLLGNYTNGFSMSFISFPQTNTGTTSESKTVFQYIVKGSTPPIDYTQEYLTFEPISSAVTYSHGIQTFQYSLDDGETWSTCTTSQTVTVNVGQKMKLKGSFNNINQDRDTNRFTATGGTWKAYGNLLSLLYGDTFASVTVLGKDGLLFCFYHCQNLIDIDNLKIPITSITITRGLRATFRDCGFSSVPSDLLPATTLSRECYMGTFEECANLVKAPLLPATTIPSYGYFAMFNNCTSLNEVTCLATSGIGGNKTQLFLNGVASSGTFYKAPSASWSTGQYGVPSGWTILDAQ